MTSLNESDLVFINGKAVIKSNRKTIAKVYDRNTFFKGTRLEGTFKQFPYSIEISAGIRECSNLNECITVLNQYL